jgi:ATP-dependent helicase/nuclease subunit B
MDELHALPRQIDQALARGWTVLTANQRAARTLRHAFDRRQRALGRPNWQPPAISAWDAWTAGLWHRLLLEGHASALLLNRSQEQTLWRAILESEVEADEGEADRADRHAASLRPADSLAALAADAWLLLHAYRARRRLHASAGSADTRAFERWASEFERRAALSNYLSAAQLPEVLRAAFSGGNLQPALPGRDGESQGFLLVGFDSKTPAQTALLEAAQAAGARIAEFHPQSPSESHPQSPGAPSFPVLSERVGPIRPRSGQATLFRGTPPEPNGHPTPPISLIRANDGHEELTSCARWLRARLTERPGSRLAVIVPAIEAERAEIDRVFRQILSPELEDIAAPAHSGPFEFSLGVPLARTAMVATALDILRWAVGPLPLDRVSALLLSPHFAPARAAARAETSPEHLARAEFDAFILRRRPFLQPEISVDALLDLASRPKSSPSLPALLKHLRALRPLFRYLDSSAIERAHADWAATIHELLEAAGWADPARDDSVEFQTRRKWESALDELATLDFFGLRVRLPQALAALERIAAQTLFAPQSRHAPIQIMGPLESAGSSFDALWFLRAGDLTWPAATSPNPLLPWHLQRELAMPGADPARDSAHARRITERIAASAPIVLFSYAQETADGHQRASPCLAGLDLTPSSVAGLALSEPAPTFIHVEEVVDDATIPPPPDRVLHGGAGILQTQAACGFRAFAEKRLFSAALDARELGLDPRERGNLVHVVLEGFWAEVETQAALARLTTAERDAALARAIDRALTRHTTGAAPGWGRAYLDTERERLLKLLRPWLDYELHQRPPFAIRSREESLEDVRIGPLRLNIRVDRVDTSLLDGEPAGEIILDYKTGPARPADWLGVRPDAPQLPLYAAVSAQLAATGPPTATAPLAASAQLAATAQLAAVAFASIRPGKDLGLAGYEARGGVLPKPAKLKADSLAAQVDAWRTVLTALAEDFHSGQARVSPKQYPTTCRTCQQRLLCRLDPAKLNADALEELDPDAAADPSNPEADRG